MPLLLTVENKRNRLTDSIAGLVISCRNSSEFLRRHITIIETWIHFYKPEKKEQSKQ